MSLEAVVIASNGKRQEYEVSRMASEKVIVRASNPGQFEADNEPPWTRDLTSDTLFHMGNRLSRVQIARVYQTLGLLRQILDISVLFPILQFF